MNGLPRRYGFATTVAIIVGGVIGSGIFMKPALMASQLGSPLLLLSVWVVAGVITLFGAMTNAEAAAMFPESGGQYVFFRKMYGDGFAFLYGWSAFAVFNTAGNASIAYVTAQYTTFFNDLPTLPSTTVATVELHLPFIGSIFPLDNIGVKALTILIVLLLTLLNVLNANAGSAVQRVLTGLKAAAILLVIFGLFGSAGHGQGMFTSSIDRPVGWSLLGAYVAALGGAFWAYDGWNNITFIAGEVKVPQRNVPRGLLVGMIFCTLVYMLVNLAYLHVLPIGAMAGSSMVASDAATVAWGAVGGGLIAAMVVLCTLGANNANVLATARVTYALGEEHRAFQWAGKVRSGSFTPGNALWANAIWTCALVISGSFDMLTDMLIFVSWFFYGMSALGVIILRRRMRDVPRPYKVPGYPWVTGVFVLFTSAYLVITLITDVTNYVAGRVPLINSLLGVCITCVGIPLYYWSRKRRTT